MTDMDLSQVDVRDTHHAGAHFLGPFRDTAVISASWPMIGPTSPRSAPIRSSIFGQSGDRPWTYKCAGL